MTIPKYIEKIRDRIGNDLIMMPAVTAIVRNNEGEILLERRSDNLAWALPGGAIEPGEEPADTLVREVYEETGLRVAPELIVGVYAGSQGFVTFPNGHEVAVVNITFACRVIGGELRADNEESLEVGFFDPTFLPDTLEPWHRERINHLQSGVLPFFHAPQSVSSNGR